LAYPNFRAKAVGVNLSAARGDARGMQTMRMLHLPGMRVARMPHAGFPAPEKNRQFRQRALAQHRLPI